jgi:group I intron endonuclease
MKKYCVYCHINKENGKKYVGITCNNVKRRWANGYGYAHCTLFFRAIKKYGWDGFLHEILESGLSKDEAQVKERMYISIYKSNNPKFGYNLTSGGEEGKEISAEARERLIQSHIGIKPTRETLEKRSKSLKMSWASESVKERHRRAMKVLANDESYKEKISKAARKNWDNPDYVKKQRAGMEKVRQTKEYHECLSKALKAAWSNPEIRKKVSGGNNGKAKKVICIDSGETFSCAAEAGRSKNISINGICMCCRGERKTAGKLQWKFA